MQIQHGRVSDSTGMTPYDPTQDAQQYWVKFYTKPEKQEFESQKQGKPIYKEEIFAEITKNKYFTQTTKLQWKPNHFGNMAPTAKTEEILALYKPQWEAFQAAQEHKNKGATPLHTISDDKALLASLEDLGVSTVEQVIEMGDQHQVLFELERYDLLQSQARAHVNREKEIADKDAEIARLKAQLAATAQPSKNKKKKKTDAGEHSDNLQGRSGPDKPSAA